MAKTYEPIATTTTSSNATTISFGSIPNTYTDLRLVLVGTCSGNGNIFLRFNGDTSTNYSQTYMYATGTGTNVVGSGNINLSALYLTLPQTTSTTIPYLYTIDIFSYKDASLNKTALIRQNADQNGSGTVSSNVGLWRSTSAINTVLFYVNAMNFTNGFTATLYGIKAA